MLRHQPPDGVQPHLNHLLERDTADEVVRFGVERKWFGDLYHRTLTVSWPVFLATGSTVYIAANLGFGALYLLQPGSITAARPGSFADAFFFSVQTMATIGYGVMSPATFYANLLMTVETAAGLLFLALTTGLIFARFSRPTARVLFSRVAVVGPYNGVPTLSVRLANQRSNQLLAAEVTMTLVRDELTREGELSRRFYDLKLVRERSPVFALSFRAMHPIDRDSPLYGMNYEKLAEQHAEIVVIASGVDETLVQPVGARTSYLPHEILWSHRFVDIFGWTEDGRRAIDYRRFHDTMRIA
ncbi:MAG TPA: ion channel [Stellaceae bacterium]|nr:ion channel [Stellaceae bacterium]